MAGRFAQIDAAPGKGQSIQVHSLSEQHIKVLFSLKGAVFSVSGRDLVITLPDGGTIVLRDGAHLARTMPEPPLMELHDGNSVSLKDLLAEVEHHGGTFTMPDTIDGINRIGSLGTDSWQRGGEDLEKDSGQREGDDSREDGDEDGGQPQYVLSQGSGLFLHNVLLTTAAIVNNGIVRSVTGDLVPGINRYVKLPTDHWGREEDKKPEAEGFVPLLGDGPGEESPLPFVQVSGETVAESAGHIGFHIALSIPSGDGVALVSISGLTAVMGLDVKPVLEIFDGVSWTVVQPGPDGVYALPVGQGDSGIRVRMPLLDDHLSEATESVGLTVESLLVNGNVVTQFASGTNLSGTSNILDDSLPSSGTPGGPGELDGPVVSVWRTSEEVAYEKTHPWTGASQKHTFLITLKQCCPSSSPDDYANPNGSGLLLQDMTVELQLSGTAASGRDYVFGPSPAMRALIDAGRMTLSGPDADGKIVLVLHGQYDASGAPSAHPPFALADLGDLRFEAPVMPDALVEGREDIRLSIVSVKGNEAQIGVPDADGGILDREGADPKVTVAGETVNESEGHVGFIVTVDVPEGTGSLLLSLEGVTATPGMDYTPVLEYHDGTAWVPAPVVGGHFRVPVSGSGPIRVRVPLVDDHMSESDEILGLKVEGMTFEGVEIADFDPASNFRADSTILDDDAPGSGVPGIPGELDGPVVSVERTSNVTEFEEPGGIQLPGTHTFLLTLKECVPSGGIPGNYVNPDGSGELLQDMTVELKLSGSASLGSDYTFGPSAAMRALIDAGKMTCAGPDASGNITLVLHGQYGADGSASTHAPFTLADLAGLSFDAPIIADHTPEALESIRLTLVSVSGNEAQVGEDTARGFIADDPSRDYGPVLTMTSPGTANESRATDPWNAPADNLVWHQISLDLKTPEDIRTVITLTGRNGAALFDGTNAGRADFAWANKVEYTTDNGSTWLPLTAGHSFDPATGKAGLTIPEGATGVRFGVRIIDDMRETSDGASEGYIVTLELEEEGGVADAGAVLGSGTLPETSLDTSTTIIPDVRPSGDLNPPGFDGPFVVLAADPARENLQTNGSGKHFAPESGGKLPFSLSLYRPDGSNALFTGSGESVTVSLTINGGSGFQIQDLFAPDAAGKCGGTIPYTIYNDDGTVARTGSIAVSNLTGTAGSLDITLVFPKGCNKITFDLPINDDPLGASGASLLDRFEEQVAVTITKVVGNEARVDDTKHPNGSSASLLIRDDAADNPGTVADDASLEGVRVGLAWKAGTVEVDNGTFLTEGKTGVILITLYDASGAALTQSAANNPYYNYTQHNKLPEDLEIKLSFADTKGADNDLDPRFSTEFIQLVLDGKVTVSIGGTTYTTGNASLLNGLEITGDFTVTLKGGQFDLYTDQSSLGINAHALGDNISEFDKNVDYRSEEPAADETFGLTIKQVTGNESVIKQDAREVEAVVTDAADGVLTLAGGNITCGTGSLGGHWSYTISTGYPDGEKANATGGVAQGQNTGAAVPLPGETVTFMLRVTDSAIMQHGEEYEVSAYDLFLSVNGLTESASGVPSRAAYGDGGSYTPGAGGQNWIIVSLETDWTTGSTGLDSAVYKLHVPVGYWGTMAGQGGSIAFDISQGDNACVSTQDGKGGFTLTLEEPKMVGGVPSWDMKGEIINVAGGVISAEEDDIRIELALKPTPVIYENYADSTHSNVAVYKLDFSQWRDTAKLAGDLRLACDITFDFTLRSFNASFNENTLDNTLYDSMGDFALCDSTGKIYPYKWGLESSDPDSLQSVLQDILDMDYHGNVLVQVFKNGDEFKFSFTIKEGTNLEQGIDLHFAAMDDGLSELGEKFGAQISNVKSDGNAIPITITGNGGRTEICDEPEIEYSGFAIALGDGAGYEKLVDANLSLKDGKGDIIDGKVHMPLYAYILSNANKFSHGSGDTNMLDDVPDGTILTLTNLKNIYLAQTGNSVSNPATDTAFQQFIIDHFRPVQDITITMELRAGTGSFPAGVNEDFKDMTEQVIPHQNGEGKSNWTLKIDGDRVYFENELLIDAINDYTQNGGDLDFIVKLTETEGNESRLVTSAESGDVTKVVSGHETERTGTVHDYHDGPAIIGFGPVDGKLYEPVDTAHNGTPAAHKANSFAIELDRVTEQDMILWLDIKGLGGAVKDGPDSDYHLGSGIYQVVNSTTYKTWNADGTEAFGLLAGLFTAGKPSYFEPVSGAYFCVIKAGKLGTEFQVMIKDDNRQELDDRLSFQITTVQGGEATFMDNGYTIPWDGTMPYRYAHDFGSGTVEVLVDPANRVYYQIVNGTCGDPVQWNAGSPPSWLPSVPVAKELQIVDDGFGPVVSLASNSLAWDAGDTAPKFTLTFEDTCQEAVDVIVVLKLNGGTPRELTFTVQPTDLNASGNVVLDAAKVMAAWQAAGGGALPNRAGFSGTVDIYIKDSLKGETIPNHDPQRVVIYTSGGPVIELYDLEDMIVTEHYLPGEPGAPASSGFMLKMNIPLPAAIQPGGLSFTLDLPDSAHSLLGADTATRYTVTFSKADLDTFSTYDTVFQLQVTINGGVPELVVTGGGETWNFGPANLTVTGGAALPAAKGDDVIGDENHVTVSINNVTGAQIRPGSDSVKSVEIRDGTYATIKFFMETEAGYVLVDDQASLAESLGIINMKAVLVLTDSSGNIVYRNNTPGTALDDFIEVHTTKGLEFTVHHQDGSVNGATCGEDYAVSGVVRIGAGESNGDFKLTITQDDKTEGASGKEGFSLWLEPTNETETVCAGEMSHIKGGLGSGNNEFGKTGLFIEDDNSGPSISWDLDKTTVPEGEAFTLTWESMHNGGRQVVAEDVEMVFHIVPGSGFTAGEIESLTFNGQNYTSGGSPDLASILNTSGSTWVLTLPKGMPANTGINSLTITLKNDVQTEGNEKLTITLVSVTGGETDIAAGSDQPKDVIITDTLDGGQVDLLLDPANTGEEFGQVAYILKLSSDGAAIDEDVVITLTVNEASRKYIDANGAFTISLPGGPETVTIGSAAAGPGDRYHYDTTTGKLTVTLPPGCSGSAGHEIAVNIPVLNDSLVKVREFGLALSDVSGGEMSQAPSLAYNSQFIQEEGAAAGHGGMNEFAISVGALPQNCYGALRFEVGGIADPTVVKEIFLDNVLLVHGTDWEWNGNNIRVTTASGKMKTSYNLKVYYKDDADSEHLELTKKNIDIENAGLIGREVVTTIDNETTASKWTGPEASLDMSAFGSTVEEGQSITGKLVLAMPGLEPDGNKLLEAVTVTLTVPDASGFTAAGYSVTRVDATTVKVTIPKDTPIPSDGKIQIDFSANVPDNCLQTNGNATMAVTGITKTTGLYESYTYDGTSTSIAVTDNATNSGPYASLVSTGPGGAPDTYGVNILVELPAGAPGTLVENLAVTLQLTGNFDPVAHPGGTITITIPQGELSNDILIYPVEIHTTGTNPSISVAINSFTGGGMGSNAYEMTDFDSAGCDPTIAAFSGFAGTAFSGFMLDDGQDAELFAAFGAALVSEDVETLVLPGTNGTETGGGYEAGSPDVLSGDTDRSFPSGFEEGRETSFVSSAAVPEGLLPDAAGEQLDDLLRHFASSQTEAPGAEGAAAFPDPAVSSPGASAPGTPALEAPAQETSGGGEQTAYVEPAPVGTDAETLALIHSLLGVTG